MSKTTSKLVYAYSYNPLKYGSTTHQGHSNTHRDIYRTTLYTHNTPEELHAHYKEENASSYINHPIVFTYNNYFPGYTFDHVPYHTTAVPIQHNITPLQSDTTLKHECVSLSGKDTTTDANPSDMNI